MKTSDVTPEGTCPVCGGKVSKDIKGREYVRHLHRLSDGTKCPNGLGQKG